MSWPVIDSILLLALGAGTVAAQEPVVDVARYEVVPPPGVPPIPNDDYHGFGKSLATADLDLDGDLSVIVGEPVWGPTIFDPVGYIALYESAFAADGTSNVRVALMWPPSEFEGINTRFGQSLAIGDYDADGYPDLASYISKAPGGARSTGGALVLFGPIADDGTYARKQIAGAGAEGHHFGVSGMAAADFDGDGICDLAAGGFLPGYSGYVRFLFGEASVGLGSPINCPFPGVVNLGRGISAFDPDGDGVSDVVVGADNFPGSAYWLPCGSRTPDSSLARHIVPTRDGIQYFGDNITPANFSRSGGPPDRLLFGAWGAYERPGSVVLWQMNGHQTYYSADRFGEIPEIGDSFGRTPAFGRWDAAGFRGSLFACGSPTKKVDGIAVGGEFWGIRVWRESDGDKIQRTGRIGRTGQTHLGGESFGTATIIADMNHDALPDIVASDAEHQAVVIALTGIR